MRPASSRVLLRTARRPLAVPLLRAPVAAAPSPAPLLAAQQTRSFFGLFGKKKKTSGQFEAVPEPTVILEQDDLFHPLSKSPFKELREKGERISTYAICPVSYEKHHETKAVKYECPDCGFPTHASRERWEEGHEEHAESCPRLREVNEDEHDLRSGRRVVEYENMPSTQPYEQAVNLQTWDTFFFTRGFVSINSQRAMRHVSKLLTYPITVMSVLHQNGPFTAGNGRITSEGRRSMAAIHSILHPPPGTSAEDIDIRPMAPFRVFLLGARGESTLPADIWLQLANVFPRTPFNIYFIGPEAGIPLVKGSQRQHLKMSEDGSKYGVPSCTVNVTPQLRLISLKAPYEAVHNQLGPFDPYQDVFFAFSPGLGFPDQSLLDPNNPTPDVKDGEQPLVQAQTSWKSTLQSILETKCGLFFTAFSPTDLARDVSAIFGTQPPTSAPGQPSEYPSNVQLPTKPIPPIEGVSDEFELILTPGTNPFASRKWEIADWDTRVAVKTNWGIWGIRGKKYEVVDAEDERA
ncbi:hypothetical protein CspHIS471_0312670 [Cutaneotrichosporon sp. HIS471]|nr:hypothetical protein CspHIS471_0312670 [Cutaneotrichosporon sp. HIS471]